MQRFKSASLILLGLMATVIWAGNVPLAQAQTKSHVFEGKVILNPPVLAKAYGRLVHKGWMSKRGYYFCIYLPGRDKRGLPENTRRKKFPPVYARAAEQFWCALAWPMTYGETGLRAYFIDQDGDVLATGNRILPYSGTTHPPMPWSARKLEGKALPNMATKAALNCLGLDGKLWSVVR